MANVYRYSRLDWNNSISEEVRGLWLASWVQEGFVGKRPIQELLSIVLEKQRIFQGIRRRINSKDCNS